MKTVGRVVVLVALVGLGAACTDKAGRAALAEARAQAELEGIPPTGNKVAVSAICIFRVKDGLVVEEIEEADMLGLYQQLGMELKPKAEVK